MIKELIENARQHVHRNKTRLQNLAGVIDLHEKYQGTFKSPDGEFVLKHLMKIGHIYESTFVPGDPTATAFREGQRHIVLTILRGINKDTAELIKQIEDGAEEP